MKIQFETSAAVRPQPRQISSNSVEQIATQGESLAVKTPGDEALTLENVLEEAELME